MVLQFIADHVETNPLFRESKECQSLIMEALKYHLLPERRSSFQSPRTKPRKSTVGIMFAVGGMDCNKGKFFAEFYLTIFLIFWPKRYILGTFRLIFMEKVCNCNFFFFFFLLFIPRHMIVVGYYGFTLDVRVSVCLSYTHPSIHQYVFGFWMIT